MCALFINAAILVLAAAAFHWSGHQDVAEIQDAHRLLTPLLGVPVASAVFIVALLGVRPELDAHRHARRSNHHGRVPEHPPAPIELRRVITRALAIVPAVCVIGYFGEGRTTELLVAEARSCCRCSWDLRSGR